MEKKKEKKKRSLNLLHVMQSQIGDKRVIAARKKSLIICQLWWLLAKLIAQLRDMDEGDELGRTKHDAVTTDVTLILCPTWTP